MDHVTRRLAPLLVLDRWSISAYLASLVIGLGALAIAGRAFAGANQFDHFVRFHPQINPGSYYYPTASQVIQVARASARPDQILVVVGGSSVMYGSGEGAEEVWTLALKEELGDRFGVVNLALPSGAPAEHGSVAAQALMREGRPVIFVAQVYPGSGEADGVVFRYVVWDALMKGLLPPSDERDAALASPSVFGAAVNAERAELRIRSALDSVLYFTDFWQAIGYRYVFTLWQPMIQQGMSFTAPRITGTEPYARVPKGSTYPAAFDAGQERAVVAELGAWCAEQPDGTWKQKDLDFVRDSFVRSSLSQQIFPGLRERSVVLATARSPYFAKRLPPDGYRCWLESYSLMTEYLANHGFHAVLVGEDWTDEDFVDLLHPSASGGTKMAAELAPIIRALAAQLYPELGVPASDAVNPSPP
jgi:hypothetical protein